MSIDWDKRHNALGKHKHLASDILVEETGSPASSGGVSVDNGTDPPAEVTTLVAPGADVATPGSATLPVAVFQKTVVLTDAQIKALGANASVTIVPAPGAGRTLVFVSAVVVLDSSAGGYTNVDTSPDIHFALEGFTVSAAARETAANLLFDAFGGGIYGCFFPPAAYVLGGAIAIVSVAKDVPNYMDNYALQITGSNSGLGAFTGGNAANTLKATVLYMVVDL